MATMTGRRGLSAGLAAALMMGSQAAQKVEPTQPNVYRSSHEAFNPKRRAKKATGLKGRQWVKHRKAEQRAKR